MSYVKCVNNKAYIQFQDEPLDETDTTDLTIGKVYKAAPQTEDDRRLGELRVFDDTGEDYLFPAEYFEPYLPNGDHGTRDSLGSNFDEAELLQKINQGVPAEVRNRYDELHEKMLDETLTTDEQQELIELSDQIEFSDAERLHQLVRLAELRKVTVDALMDQLGLQRRVYA